MSDSGTPSAKTAKDENFPVASILIARCHRQHLHRFYAFVRAADDIADHHGLPPLAKLEQLTRLENVLLGRADDDLPVAQALRESLERTGLGRHHLENLLAAFRQDVTKERYQDMKELIAYCALSAAPVGRFMLDLHGEDDRLYPVSDHLCAALQILNHLQDCKADYLQLNRVYLPKTLLARHGLEVAALQGDHTTSQLRRVLDELLDEVDSMLDNAADLSKMLASRRLAAEAAVIYELARQLTRRLRHLDPLAERVALSKAEVVLTSIKGLCRCRWLRRAQPGGAAVTGLTS